MRDIVTDRQPPPWRKIALDLADAAGRAHRHNATPDDRRSYADLLACCLRACERERLFAMRHVGNSEGAA